MRVKTAAKVRLRAFAMKKTKAPYWARVVSKRLK